MKRVLLTLGLLYFFNSFCQANDLEKLSYEELDSMFESLYIQGKYHEGIKYAEVGRERAKLEFGEMDSTFASFTGKLSIANRELGLFVKAENQNLEVLEIYDQVLSKTHPEYILSLNNLAILYYYTGRYAEAEDLYLKVLTVGEKVLGTSHSDYAEFLNNLAMLYVSMSKYKEAEHLQLEARKIFVETNKIDHADYIILLSNLARLYVTMGQYERAEPIFQEAIKKGATVLGKGHPVYMTILNNLASFYSNMGNYEHAEQLFLEALKIAEEVYGKKHAYYARLLNNLSSVYTVMGRFAEAEPLNLEALKIAEMTIGKNHPNYALLLNNISRHYRIIGRYQEAESTQLEALNIYANTLGKDHPYYATVLNGLAVLYESTQRNEKAEIYYFENLKIRAKKLGKEHPSYATTLNNLAVLFEKTGQVKRAEQYYLNSLKIRIKSLGKDHHLSIWTLNNLANLNKKMGQYQKSWEYAHQAICTASRFELNPNIDSSWIKKLKHVPFISSRHIIEIEKTLACMYELLKIEDIPQKKTNQMLITDLAIHLLKRSRDSYINDQDKLRLIAKSHDWMLRSLNSLNLDKNFDQAFEYIEFHKSALLLEANLATQAYQLGNLPDSLIHKERRMKKNHSELQAKMLEDRPDKEKDSLRAQLNELNLRISALKKQIEKKYPKYARFQYQTHQVTLPKVQQTLQDQDALIEYILGDSILHIFYIDQDQSFIKKIPIGTNLSANIKSYRNLISHFNFLDDQKDKMKDFNQLAHWFYKQLLAPIKAELQDKEHLIIIPDGELYHLPFETFLVNAPSNASNNFSNLHYLIQDHEVTYNYSASLWAENLTKKQTPKHNGELFALAANYQRNKLSIKDSTQIISLRTRLRNDLNYLPAARQEVESLALSFTGFFGYDSLANERVFKEKASNYGVIHLAMHGLLNEKFPTLSSLAFTNTQDSTENNNLQAYEISKLDLNADLVVLSACQTGYGKFERGNGVASLARAFMYAGVPSLVVSLWQVDDKATSKIMKEFYLNLADGMSKSEALRQAKLTYIKNAPEALKHPAYWSPFIQIGNSEPIQIQRKYAYTPWYMAIVTMVLVAGLVFWKRKWIF